LTHGGETYLATNCVVFAGGVRQPQQERLVLLRENGTGYDYVGELLDYGDAVDNGGERIEQADLAVAQNGAVLLVATPIREMVPQHLGCVTFEVMDLDTASVRRDGNGDAVRLASVSGDDPGIGPGACTYDAESSTGIVLVLHDQDPETEVAFSMRATGVHPLGIDADADGLADTADNCPAWANPAQNLPSWSVPAGDSDCDGFPDTVTASGRGRETFIESDPSDQCADTLTPNDETAAGQSPWPPDINDNRIVDLSDVSLMGSAYNKSLGQAGYQTRKDLNANDVVDLSDISLMSPFYNRGCTP
jgi:hypothetical protein